MTSDTPMTIGIRGNRTCRSGGRQDARFYGDRGKTKLECRRGLQHYRSPHQKFPTSKSLLVELFRRMVLWIVGCSALPYPGGTVRLPFRETRNSVEHLGFPVVDTVRHMSEYRVADSDISSITTYCYCLILFAFQYRNHPPVQSCQNPLPYIT